MILKSIQSKPCLLFSIFCLWTSQVSAQDTRFQSDSDEVLQNLIVVGNHIKASQITSADVEKFVPLDMEAGTSSSHIASKVADRGLQVWFNSDAVQGSVLGQTANTVQNTMKLDTSVQTSELEHKFTVQLMALQASARLVYKGYLNAVLNHNASNQQTDLQFSEKVFSNKELYVKYVSTTADQLSTMGMTWGF